MRYQSGSNDTQERQETINERAARQRQERKAELTYSETDEKRWAINRNRVIAKRRLANKSEINYSKIRDLQASKKKLNCTRCAVKTMKYLVSKNKTYLKLPFLSKTKSQTQEEVVADCNKDGFLAKHDKKIDYLKGGYFDIPTFESKFTPLPVGTIAFLFGAVRIAGETNPIGHTLIAYKAEEGIKYLDSTTPAHFDLAFNEHKRYFEDGFYSVSKQKKAEWMQKFFEGMIVSDV